MKLVDKFTLWFIAITVLVTPVSMYISYNNIKEIIDSAEIKRLKEVNDKIAAQIKTGESPNLYMLERPASIRKLTGPLPANTLKVREDHFYNNSLKRNECRLSVSSFYRINGINYSISSNNYIIKAEQILRGMLKAVFWKLLLLVLILSITARLISRYILSSFRQTLKLIQNFSLQKKEKISLPTSSTAEFRQLNCFLKKMTDRVIEDYSRVKEYSENASHEVQTPLAIIRSKLELLAETGIRENQAELIMDMQNAIEKLTRINRSLLLLTKLENHEYETSDELRFCKVTKEALSSFNNHIQIKNLTVNTNIDKNILIRIHPVLAEILVNNLLSNAVRHNIEDGKIEVSLSSEMLLIRNTGLPPEVPVDELFERFKKSNQCANSIGLGLAIVKQICTVNAMTVKYIYSEGWHTLRILFPEKIVSSLPAGTDIIEFEAAPAFN